MWQQLPKKHWCVCETICNATPISNGGRDRRRSGDPTLFRRVLCQLSYSTIGGPAIAEPDGGLHHRLIDGKYRQ